MQSVLIVYCFICNVYRKAVLNWFGIAYTVTKCRYYKGTESILCLKFVQQTQCCGDEPNYPTLQVTGPIGAIRLKPREGVDAPRGSEDASQCDGELRECE